MANNCFSVPKGVMLHAGVKTEIKHSHLISNQDNLSKMYPAKGIANRHVFHHKVFGRGWVQIAGAVMSSKALCPTGGCCHHHSDEKIAMGVLPQGYWWPSVVLRYRVQQCKRWPIWVYCWGGGASIFCLEEAGSCFPLSLQECSECSLNMYIRLEVWRTTKGSSFGQGLTCLLPQGHIEWNWKWLECL